MNTAKSIFILNTFLSIQHERFESFEINTLETNEQDLKNILYQMKAKSFACKRELIDEITALGGKPTYQHLNSKKFLHFWLDFKNVFVPTRRDDLLHICEYNEYLNIKNFSEILQNNIQLLNFRQIQILKKQLNLLQENHDYLQALGEVSLQQHKIKYEEDVEEFSNY